MPRHHGYPAARVRDAGVPGAAPLKYRSSEVLRLATASETEFVEVGQFGGQPDAIDLAAVAEAHRVRLRDHTGRLIGEYLVPANETVATFQTAEVIEAQALAATAGRQIAATGKWVEPAAPLGPPQPVPPAPQA